MVSDLERVLLQLAAVVELCARQSEHLESNRLVQMLECQQERTAIFNELVELSIEKYLEEPRVRPLIEQILSIDSELALKIEATVGEHKQTIASIQKAGTAIKAYTGL